MRAEPFRRCTSHDNARFGETRIFPASAVLDHLADGVLVTDADLDQPGGPRIVYANRAFGEITGYGCDELLGQSPRLLQGPDTDPAVMRHLSADLRQGRPSPVRRSTTARTVRPSSWNGRSRPSPATTATPQWFVAVQRDATLPARRLLDAERDARMDPLTGLPNRRHCDDVLANGAWLSSRGTVSAGHRPRPLQVDQRHARPSRRRRGPARGRRAAATRGPRRRLHRPLGRRGVLRADPHRARGGR